MNTLSKSVGLRSIIIVLIALFFFGGVSITGVAAQSAIPGDALYSVKTSIEQTRLTLANDASDRAMMHLGFAEERLEEIGLLIKEGRNREIKNAVLSFESSMNSALIELATVSKGDPIRAAELSKEITSALTRYAQTLSTLAANAPDSIKFDVIRAFDSTQLAGSVDISSADDNSNTNANDNGNSNSNMNGNDNSDDNGNLNGNDNATGNANSNTNDNSDDNGNSNDNSDDNVNSNTNNNTNSNDNSNSNDNGSGGNGNDNGSGNNSNDNSNGNDNGGGGGGGGGGGNDNGGKGGG